MARGGGARGAGVPNTRGQVFSLAPYVAGNGTADDTTGLRAAVTAALANGARTLWAPPDLTCLVSGSIDLQGLSLVSPGGFRLLADPNAAIANWQFSGSRAENDVAVLCAVGQSNWSIEGVTVDCQGAYAKGMTAWGGDFVTFRGNTVKNCASAGLQFMGSRRIADAPVRYSRMIDNVVQNSKWAFVCDGQVNDSSVVNNTSLDATNAHVSVDPNEAEDTNIRFARGLIISGNILRGTLTAPGGWYAGSSAFGAAAAIRLNRPTTSVIFGTIVGNYIHNWTTTGILLQRFSGAVGSNSLHTDASLSKGTLAIDLVDMVGGSFVTGNSLQNWVTGIRVNAASISTTVRGNRLYGVTTATSGTGGTGVAIDGNDTT